jgi:hypothetical protein
MAVESFAPKITGPVWLDCRELLSLYGASVDLRSLWNSDSGYQLSLVYFRTFSVDGRKLNFVKYFQKTFEREFHNLLTHKSNRAKK